MDTCTETRGHDRDAMTSQPEATALALDREKWIHKHALRILERYRRWQTPLGVASAYVTQIKEDLMRFYDDPLKRMFIETSY